MKRYSYPIVSLLILSVALIMSCSKESSNSGVVVPPAPTTKENLNRLFAGLRTVPQKFSIVAGMDTTIRGGAGTRLRFYEDSFRDRDGSTVSFGTIEIELVEVPNYVGQVLNRVTTTASGNLLVSTGMAHVRAFRHGEEIFPTRYAVGFVSNMGPSTVPMGLYYGNTKNEDSVVTWVPTTNVMGTFADTTRIDSAISMSLHLYVFDSVRQLGWVAANRFINPTAALVNTKVVVHDTGFNRGNTQVYMIFPGMNTVTLLSEYDKSDNSFSLSPGYYVPTNTTVHLVGIGNKNGRLFYSEFSNVKTDTVIPDTLFMREKAPLDLMIDLTTL